MAKPTINAYTTTGAKASIGLDWATTPFNVAVAVTVGTTGTYSIQYSLDDWSTTDANALWFTDANLIANTTVSGVTNYMFPVTRIRINITAITGTITLQTLQGFAIS